MGDWIEKKACNTIDNTIKKMSPNLPLVNLGCSAVKQGCTPKNAPYCHGNTSGK
jgi:hypothetical protein